MGQPWEQLPAESGAAYIAFQAYLALGPTRSIDAAYKAHRGPTAEPQASPKRASGRWKLWCRQHQWADRATAWDHRNQQVAQQGHEEAVKADAAAQTREQLRAARRIEQEEEEWQLRCLLIAKAKEMLTSQLFAKRASLNGQTVEVKPARWTFDSAARMVDLAKELGRMSARMPASIEEEKDSDSDDRFFETSGQLAEALPPGAVPEMPADTHVKPNIQSGKAEAGKDGSPRQPPKVRPA